MTLRLSDARRAALTAVVLALVLVAPARPAHAVSRSWTNAAGGAAATATNWSPVGTPGIDDPLLFTNGGAYTVTFASPVDSVWSTRIINTSVGLSISGTHRTRVGYEVGGAVGTRGTLSLGTLSTRSMTVSLLNGNQGRLIVTGSQLNGYGRLDISAGGLAVGFNAGATGQLHVLGGGQVASDALVRFANAGACSVQVAGGGLIGVPRSAIRTAGPNGHMHLAGTGTGYLDIFNNGLVDISGDLTIGESLGGNGTLNVYRTPTGIGTPSLTVRGRTYVGGTSSTATATGSATLTVGPNGVADFVGPCRVGSPTSGGSDRVNVTLGSTARFEGGVKIHSRTNGRFSVTGGTVQVTGGSFVWEGGVTFPITGPDMPRIELLNGGPDTIGAGSVPAQPALLVGGGGGQASLRVARPGTSLFVDGPVNLGADTQSGALTVDSSATMRAMGVTHIGGFSSACQLSVLGGAQWTGPSLELATNGGGGGVVSQGTGSAALVTGSIGVGPGTAWIRALDGGFFTQRGTGLALVVNGASQLEVRNGGTFSTTAQLSLNGFAVVENGTFEATRLDIQSSGLVTSHASTIRAPIWVAANGVFEVETFGPPGSRVSAGSPSAADGFVCEGNLVVHRDTLELLDLDGADLVGHVQLDSGVVVLPPGSKLVGGLGLHGSGGIFGELLNRSEIHPSDAILDLGGRLVSHDAVIAGGMLRLIAGGELEASGVITSRITNGGTLRLGPAPAHLVLMPPQNLATSGVATEYTQSAAGALAIQICAPGLATHDTLEVVGGAVLGGRLELWTVPGYFPVPGDTFTVLNASLVSGTFAEIRINGAPGAGRVSLTYGSTSVHGVFLTSLVGVDDPPTPVGVSVLRFAIEGGLRAPMIALDLPAPGLARIALYDVAGREAIALVDGLLPAGRHRFTIANQDLPSGVYFARAWVGARRLTTRFALVR